MRSYQVRRKRPSFVTAHDFHRDGSFLIDPKQHKLSGKERQTELDKIGDELEQLVKHEFPKTQNLEYAILKCHLIIEYALTQYIRCFSAVFVSTESIRFTFSQRLEVAYLLGFGNHDPILLPTVERLNQIRNQVAHTFKLDRGALDEMLRINSEDYDDFTVKNDRERITRLRSICRFICGRVAGESLAAHVFATRFTDRVVSNAPQKNDYGTTDPET